MRVLPTNRAGWLPLLVLSLCASAPAAAKPVSKPPPVTAPSALQLYSLSLTANRRFSFEGQEFLTVWRDDASAIATATTISHLPPSKDCIVYTAPQNKKGNVIVVNGNDVWTYTPKDNLIIHSREPADQAQPQQTQQFKLLLSNYRLKVLPKPIMIGERKAFGVYITPYAPGRPYDRIWIDPYTGLPLRREKYHADNSIASVSYFSDIHFNVKIAPSQFTPARWADTKARIVEQPVAAEAPLDPSKLPQPFTGRAVIPRDLRGYALQKVTLMREYGHPALHLLYSDGLNTLSLFETMRLGRAPTHLPSSRPVLLGPGETARVSQRYAYSFLSWDTPSINYTFLGDMSVKMLVGLAQATGSFKPPPIRQPLIKPFVRQRQTSSP